MLKQKTGPPPGLTGGGPTGLCCSSFAKGRSGRASARWAAAAGTALTALLGACLLYSCAQPESSRKSAGEDEARKQILAAIGLYDARGYASARDEKRILTLFGSMPAEAVVQILEESYPAADAQTRVRILAGCSTAMGLICDATKPVASRIRSLALKALADDSPAVAAAGVTLVCGLGCESQELQQLLRSRIRATEDATLLCILYQSIRPRGAIVLLEELDKPVPPDEKGRRQWKSRVGIAMDWCVLSPADAPPALSEGLLDLMVHYPDLADGAAKCLVRIRGVRAVPRLKEIREIVPDRARQAVDAALAVLDTNPDRLDSMQAWLAQTVILYDAGLRPIEEVESRYGWLCFVAVESRSLSLAEWLVACARNHHPEPRYPLIDIFVQRTEELPYMMVWGLGICADSQLRGLFTDYPDTLDTIERALSLWSHDRRTPDDMTAELKDEDTRLRALIKEQTDGRREPLNGGKR